MTDNNIKPSTSQGDDFGFFSDDEIPMKTATKQGPQILFDPEIPDHDMPTANAPNVVTQESPATKGDSTQTQPNGIDPAAVESEQPVEEKKRGFTSAHAKVLLSAALLVIGAVALWPAPPVPTIVAPVTAPTGAPAAPTAEGAPGAPAMPTGEAAPPALEIATTGADEEAIDRLEQDVESAVKRLSPAEQVCSNTKGLTSFDRHQCNTYGAEKFFKCTEQTGRFWNSDVSGCEL